MNLVVCVLAILAVTRACPIVNEIIETVINGFSNLMFQEMVKENPTNSVIISGFPVIIPLLQLTFASPVESYDELLNSMGIPNDNCTKAAFPLINGRLQAIEGGGLELASKIYIPQNYELNDFFAKIMTRYFLSEVKNIDFNKQVESAQEINGWVEDRTNNHIKDLVNADSLGNNTRVLLVSAIYFKGLWRYKFSDKSTKDRDFHISRDITIKVPIMYQENFFKYTLSKELDCQILELPYEEARSSLLILLPKEFDGLPALEQKLKDPSLLENATKTMDSIEVNVFLPKFKIETTINLKNILPKMGIKRIFDADKAKLNFILKTNETLYVTDAIQKAFIVVNEQGAESAAANDFIIARLRHRVRPNVTFNANHPFIFILKQSNDTVIIGKFASLL